MSSDIAGTSTVHNLEMEETTDKQRNLKDENFSQLNWLKETQLHYERHILRRTAPTVAQNYFQILF